MSKQNKRIYLAGRVTGLPEDQVQAKFANKSKQLTEQGFTVYNPVDQIWAAGLKNEPWEVIMKAAIQMMMNCEELHLLPCWKESKGARLERDIAHRLEMPIVYH